MLYLHRLLLLVALGMFCVGCSSGLEGVGSGATASGDAAHCTSQASAIGLNLRSYQSDYFVVLSSADSGDAVATGQFLDSVQRTFYSSFTQAGFSLSSAPGRLVCVCLTSYNELDAYGRQADGTDASWMDGYYSYRTNRIAIVQRGRGMAARPQSAQPQSSGRPAVYGAPASGVTPGDGLNIRTTTHELAHQLAFNSGLQRRDGVYPFWLTEGLATNFEADGGSYGLSPKQSRNMPRLVSLKASGRMISLDRFTAMTAISGGNDQATLDAYAQAWGLFHYMLQRHPQQLRQYMSALKSPWAPSDGQSLRRQFESTFGPVGTVEREFGQYIDQLSRGAN